jgi:competence/damage-inducible protein cinA C-terminal domain
MAAHFLYGVGGLERMETMMDFKHFEEKVRKDYANLTRTLIQRNKTITTMESATGGQIASLITDTEGASQIIKGAMVTYSNEAKIKMGVPKEVIEKYSVYSKKTAKEMALSCKRFYQADIGVGVTGTMGNIDPENREDFELGKVYFAIATERGVKSFDLEIKPQPSRLSYKMMVAENIYIHLIQILTDERECSIL